MSRNEYGEVISNEEAKNLIAKGYQCVEGLLRSPDDVNTILRSGWNTEHLANPPQYTLTPLEMKRLGKFGAGVVGVGVGVGLVTWGVRKLVVKRKKISKKTSSLFSD